MGKIEIISASAGSGKTYRLASVLDDAIASGTARPDAVLATTFTTRAAAELKERARTRLLHAGRVEDAHRLGAARIGTVNAVCGRLVADFAFELGLAPDLRVLDERAATVALRQALARVVAADEIERLTAIKQRFDRDWSWQADVERIVTLARANKVGAEQFVECSRRSTEQLLALFGPPAADGAPLDAAFKAAVERLPDVVDLEKDETNKTEEALEKARWIRTKARRGSELEWADWLRIEGLDFAKVSEAVTAPLCAAAAGHDRHPQLHADLRDTIALVFKIAARALKAYEDYKRDWASIDFTDQEVFALGLLERPEVRERLAREIDLVLVDEFQDTSPLQLAIFLRLAEIAGRSVWVGDQKQAIFGFRGTDPALMDAAVESILAGAEPDALATSWRSRPELVRLTSEIFARGFASQGLPEGRVRLAPAITSEPPCLGPVVERWRWGGKRRNEVDHGSLAAAVREFLTDPEVRVRDRVTGAARAVRPGDVAILCYRNATCTALAHELAALGVQAELPRGGLFRTVEGRLVLAGLSLFVDTRDALAAAELARLVTFPAEGDEWLAALMERPAREAFASLDVVQRIVAARNAAPQAGALAALDAVLEATQARERCLAWGDAPLRLANLDALRAHAAVYAELCAAEGTGCTPAGLVAAYLDLAKEDLDAQAVVAQENAVVISTWHSAKGLEWPVTVLFDLDRDTRFSALGVQVVGERATFDVADPLADRRIRYWPQPYHPMQRKSPFHRRLETDAATLTARQRESRQELRLFYVGWTRARDRVVLAGRTLGLKGGVLVHLHDEKNQPIVAEPVAGVDCEWAGRRVAVRVRETAPSAPVPPDVTPGMGYEPRPARAYPPAVVVPSEMLPVASADTVDGGLAPLPGGAAASASGDPFHHIGDRLILSGDPDMQPLGEAIHGFLAADRPGLDDATRREIAIGLLARWKVEFALQPEHLLRASDGLRAWIDARWPGAIWHREWPLAHRQPNGTVVRGTADLVVEHAGGYAVIDHKSFPGSREQAVARAATYAGQLGAYGAAVHAATGKAVTDLFIHLPVSGTVVRVSC